MEQSRTPSPRYRVALFVARERRAQRIVMRETYRLLMPKGADGDPSAPFEPRIFQFSPNKLALRERIERAHKDGFELFVVGGQALAVLASEICEELQITPIIVCVGVSGPSLKGSWLSSRMIAISGTVYETESLAAFILRMKGFLKSVLLPCLKGGIGGRLEVEARKLQASLEAEGISVELVEVTNPQDASREVKKRVGTFNFLLALEACVANSIPGLARLCAENDILFCGGYGTDSIDGGAACAYGGDISTLAPHVFDVIYDICVQKKQPEEVGHKVVPFIRYCVVNRVLFLQAGMSLDLLNELGRYEDTLLIRKFVDFEGAE